MQYILLVDENGSKPIHLLELQPDQTYKKIGVLWDRDAASDLVTRANYRTAD